MSEKNKNERPSSNNNKKEEPKLKKFSGKGANGNSGERSKTTKEGWDKIDKKGQGSGDRPPRKK